MLGVLPRRYKVPSMEDLLLDKFACGKVEFIGFEFLREVGIGPMSNRTFSKGKLNKEVVKVFSCVILGGMAAEHLLFGYSELLHSDVEKVSSVGASVYTMLSSYLYVQLTEDCQLQASLPEVDFAHRQAAEATVFILSSQMEALSRVVAEAMALGGSVGFCIETIEHTLSLNNKL
ncbi:uncharacterized protein LOC121804782 isoform X1 [Salvia splendens]|nr:uncharacterized protein LOC121804782 isoform X1 [Salvia splendens]XP_042060382.1 uncharacterized protein LOC121804782 isoform X1 [Salvia splendens]